MNADEVRLNEIHAMMRRIVGNKELSAKQWQSLAALIQAATGRRTCPLCNPPSIEEIFK